MEEIQQIPQTEDHPDGTLITPRFDEEAAEMAQPVVPLATVSPRDMAAPVTSVPISRAWLLGWILVAALIGSGIGILALTLYQQHQRTATSTIQLPTAPIAQPSPSDQNVALPSPEPTRTAEAAVLTPEHEQYQISKGQPFDPRPKTNMTEAGRSGSNAPLTSHKSSVESEPHERKLQETEKRKLQATDEDDTERHGPRLRRADSNAALRPTNQPLIKSQETERITRAREISGNSRPRKVPPRSDELQPSNVGRIREIFEGTQKP